jgi:hypothetical protein
MMSMGIATAKTISANRSLILIRYQPNDVEKPCPALVF